MGDTAGHAQAAAGKMGDAFKGVLGALNQTGVLGPFGEALDGVDKALDSIKEHGKNVGAAMIGVGGALAGVGVGLSALGSKDQAARQQLQQAIEATGKSWDDYGDRVDVAIKKQEKYGNTASQTQDAMRILTQATNSPEQALQLLATASDLAAAKHESLDTASTQLARTLGGSAKLMKEFGLSAEKAADTTGKVETATKAAQKADEAAALAKQHLADVHALLAGKTTLTAAETIQLRDAQQKVTTATQTATDAHQKLAAMHTVVISKTQANMDNVNALSVKLQGQASAAADTFTGRLDAMKARFEDMAAKLGAKYGPAITAVGSLMTGLGAISEVTSAIMASSWFAAFWPVALVIAAIAAVGIAIYLMRDKFVEVFDWIRSHWVLLVDIIVGPFGVAATQIYQNWDAIMRFFKALPGQIAAVFADVWHGIVTAFRATLNAVIDLWNALHFTLPKVDVLGVHLGGETIGVPSIPHLAQGGLITQTGLVYAHAGEAITPMPAGLGGPALQMNGVTINTATDVDLIAKKIEFAVSSGLGRR
jgi:hypothetical protein